MKAVRSKNSPPQLRKGKPRARTASPREAQARQRAASRTGRSLSKGLGWDGVVQKSDSFDQHHPGAASPEVSPSRARAASHPSSAEEGSNQDLTQEIERLRAEVQELKQHQKRGDDDRKELLRAALRSFEELYDFAPVAFVTLDRRGMMLGLNEKTARLLAFRAEWLRERPFLVFLGKRDLRRFLEVLSRLRQTPGGQERIELDLSVGARSIPVQLWIGSFAREGQYIYRVAMVELTEVKSMERELKEALHNWHSLVESAPDIIITVDRNGTIRFANRYAWGYPIRALVGTQITDYVAEKDRARLEKSLVTAFDRSEPSVCEARGANGEERRWYSFGFGPVHIPTNAPDDTTTTTTTTTVTIRDITPHKRTEESLRTSREQLREFAARLDQVREEERLRVAREIHDELGQALTILKMDLAWVHQKVGRGSNGTRKKLQLMINEVDQTIESVRKIVSELRPSILDELGLPAALEWQVSQFQERTGIRGVFESDTEDVNLPPDTAAALFRVVQEAMTNIVRHAEARQVRVALKSADSMLRIAVTDDGKGIAVKQINDRRSFGIVGMRERVHRIGGELNIFSAPGRGTRLEIAAPLQ